MSTEITQEAGHNHHFPRMTDDDWITTSPFKCKCGKTYAQNVADVTLTRALTEIKHAYGVPPRVSTHWAVAWGSENLNDGIGRVEYYDDEEDAREHVPFYAGSSVVKRTVIALRWETVPGEEPAP